MCMGTNLKPNRLINRYLSMLLSSILYFPTQDCQGEMIVI